MGNYLYFFIKLNINKNIIIYNLCIIVNDCCRAVGKWNMDLLQMCGVVLRVFYDCLVSLQETSVNETPTKQQQRQKGKNKRKQSYVIFVNI